MPMICTGPECDALTVALGLCSAHYQQQARGKPLTPRRKYTVGGQPRKIETLRDVNGITLELYLELLEKQSGGCALCGETNESGRALAVDHDHACCPGRKACGKCVRGLLCSRCNVGLGNFRDRVDLLQKAVEYLQCPR